MHGGGEGEHEKGCEEMTETLLTPGIKDNTRLFQSFTAVAGTVWIKLPANLQAFLSAPLISGKPEMPRLGK